MVSASPAAYLLTQEDHMRSNGSRLATTIAALTGAVALALSGCTSSRSVVDTLRGGAVTGSQTVVNKAVAADLTRSAQRAMNMDGIEGLAIAIVADDGSSWSAGFGSAGTG